jgi:putative acetyltransferase
MSSHIVIRPETPADVAAISDVLQAAFPTFAEARLVERLRAAGRVAISLVADGKQQILGHVLLSPVTIGGRDAGVRTLGLAPVAVRPALQRQGIGSRLILASLEQAQAAGATMVVVLGEPSYYARFGFARASDFGLANEYGAHDEFQVIFFDRASLPQESGPVCYAPEFAEL